MRVMGRALPLFLALLQFTASDSAEVCQWETFQAKCAQDEVIVMTKAVYGRMEYGRCVKRDYGYVGCSTDTLALADTRCSGRQDCKIGVPDKLFDGTRPCPDDLKLYLKADYKCIKVTSPGGLACVRGGPIAAPIPKGDEPGILSSYITEKTGCGATQSPWKLEGKPGQRWNITLVDFSRINTNNTQTNPGGKSAHCHVYAIVKDKGRSSKSETVCGSDRNLRKERQVFLSESHQLEIRMMAGRQGRESAQFLIKYKAVGCADPVQPRGGWVKRDGQRATVGCHQSGHSWRLTCNGHSWSGQRENCTDTSASGYQIGLSSMSSLSRASSMVIVLGVAVIIGILILVIGLILLKTCVFRRQRVALRNNIPPSQKSKPKLADKEGLYMTTKGGNLDYNHPPLLNRQDPYSTEENEYAYVEEFQFPGPTSCACTTTTTTEGGVVKSPNRDHGGRPGMTMTPYSLLVGGDQRHMCGSLQQPAKSTGSHGDGGQRYTTAQGEPGRNPEYFTLEPDDKRNDSCTL